VQTKKETNLGMVLDEVVKIHKLLLEERKVERCMRKMQLKMQSECMLSFVNWIQAMQEKWNKTNTNYQYWAKLLQTINCKNTVLLIRNLNAGHLNATTGRSSFRTWTRKLIQSVISHLGENTQEETSGSYRAEQSYDTVHSQSSEPGIVFRVKIGGSQKASRMSKLA
jgi:hypothetical protein